jgi:hypothetical protein
MMHRFALFALFVCATTVACGDDDPATSPSSVPAVFTATLLPSNEVPPVSNIEASGSGAVQITMHLTRDAAGAVSGGTADFYFQASGFPNDTRIQGAHIHPGVAGVNGPVIIGAELTAANTISFGQNGQIEYRQTGIAVSAANAQAVLANPSAFYFNIHSPRNTGGFARGQLTRIQ